MLRENANKALSEFGRQVVEQSKRNFLSKNASGKGSRSIRYELETFKSGAFTLEFLMEAYMEFQDKGVSGTEKKYDTPFSYTDKMPPPSAFSNWTVRRGIAPRDAKGRFLPRKSLQFLIARSVFKKGIKPSLFFTKAFETAFRDLPDELLEAYGLDVEQLMKSTLKARDTN